MKLIERIEKSHAFWFLLALSIVFFLLRLPSLFEPYWYGDEGIYQAIGITLRDGGTIYKDAFDNKPPLLLLIYAAFNSEQYLLRGATLVIGAAAIWFYLILTRLLFTKKSELVVFGTTILFAVILGLPIIEGNIANSENFMVLPIIASATLVIYSLTKKDEDRRNLILFSAGLILSLAFLIKIVAIFDLFAFLTFLVIYNLAEFKAVKLKRIYFLVVGFSVPVFITAVYFLLTGNFTGFMGASLFSNISYVGLNNSVFFPQDFLVMKALLLSAFIFIVYKKRGELSTPALFVLTWLAFSTFNAFFSQRPYTHYLLVMLPSFCLFVGLIFWDKKLQKILSVAIIFLLLLIYSSFKIYDKSPAYYLNFIDFIKGDKSVVEYISFFDKRAVTDYEIANYINSVAKPDDEIYIWGNNAQIYKMTNKIPPHRYTVLYHVTGYEDGYNLTTNALETKKPKYIIVMQDKDLLPISLFNYEEKLNINEALIYERVN